MILLGALRPYVDAAQPKRRGKDAEADAKVDRALVASVRDACAARASVIRRDADDDENWDLLDAFEGALGTHAPAKKKAPVQEEPEPWDAPAEPPKLPKAKSPPRRRAPPARRGSGYRSGASSLSEPLEKIAEAIARAHGVYGSRDAAVLFVVQPSERNALDQELLRQQLWAAHGLRVISRTLGQPAVEAKLAGNERRLTLGGAEVSVVYFRAGYTPDDYPSAKEWSTLRTPSWHSSWA